MGTAIRSCNIVMCYDKIFTIYTNIFSDKRDIFHFGIL
jgi:hypothetical protein